MLGDVVPLSLHTGTCTVCGDPLDPALIALGLTDHGEETGR